MTIDEYLAALLTLPELRVPIVSPDGKWVAWTWFGLDPVAQVYAAPTDGSAAPICLTNSPDNTLLVSWTPDSQAVLMQYDNGGDERVQLFRVAIANPQIMLPLTEAQPGYFLRGGRQHSNGRWLVYGANFDFDSAEEIEPSWLYRHDLTSGERLVLARPLKAGTYFPTINHQGTHVLYSRRDEHPGGRQTWLVDTEGENDHEILNFGADVKISASWFPDGQQILVLAETGNYRRLGRWELASGQLTWLIDDSNRNIESAYVPHGSTYIVVLEIKAARTVASLLAIESGEEIDLAAESGNLVPLAPLGNGAWVGQYYSARQPADIVRFSPADLNPAVFSSVSRTWEKTSLQPADLTAAEDFRWQSVDGLPIQGWLFRTPLTAKGTVLLIHGGPTAHSQDAFSGQVQFLNRAGFNVMLPNYRGSTGFGLAFQEAIKVEGWGGLEQEDIRTGIQALIQAGIAQVGKVGVTGTSYGGYSSWCAITRWQVATVAAAAPICGMTDLVIDYETTRPDLRPYSEEMMGGRPDQVPQRYYERSPINFVNNIRGRLLIVQGERDPNVTPENVRVVEAALKKGGVKYELLTFADEGHGISRPHNRKVLYQRLAEFFDAAFT